MSEGFQDELDGAGSKQSDDETGPWTGLAPVTVISVPVLARTAHERIAHHRGNDDWVKRAWTDPASRVLVLSPHSSVRARMTDAGRSLHFWSPEEVPLPGDQILLGEHEGIAYFAVLAWPEADAELTTGFETNTAPQGSLTADWVTLRELAVELDDLEVGLLTTAVALQAWHQRHTHCPRCGAPTLVSNAGWTRVCERDSSEHFPRTDPAVIMLIRDSQDRCLLARGPMWPAGRMSVLAGFVEAGEAAEAAVVREVFEEVGVHIKHVRYVASQPHPFPASLMLGFTAQVDGDPTLNPDPVEIAEAGWFTREQVRAAREWDEALTSPDTDMAEAVLTGLPPTMSIARQLIDAWLAEQPAT